LTTQYAYSGDGVRLAQMVNGVTTRYVNDVAARLPHVLQEKRVAAGTQTAYLYGMGMVAQSDSGAWAYQHPDALGSVRQLSDAAGQVTLARSYTPFGALLSQSGTPQGSFGFAGEQRDPAAGLTFLRARYYDPTVGRFLTRDPYPAYAAAPSTLHRYAYVENNPVNLVDPAGLQANRTRLDLRPGRSSPMPTGRSYAPRAFGGGGGGYSAPRPSVRPYNMAQMAARQAQLVRQMNAFTQAQSQGHRSPRCGPSGPTSLLDLAFQFAKYQLTTNPFWQQEITPETMPNLLRNWAQKAWDARDFDPTNPRDWIDPVGLYRVPELVTNWWENMSSSQQTYMIQLALSVGISYAAGRRGRLRRGQCCRGIRSDHGRGVGGVGESTGAGALRGRGDVEVGRIPGGQHTGCWQGDGRCPRGGTAGRGRRHCPRDRAAG
jgi:RHS repeat-associated protein